MKSPIKIVSALLLLLLFTATVSIAQTTPAKLFRRYEYGAGYHRVSESILTLTIDVAPADRAKIAIRLCSRQPLLISLALARANSLYMAELLVGAYRYPPGQVLFVRSADCLAKDTSTTPVEIWTLPENGSLPQHVEALASSQVRSTWLGKKPVNRGVRDYVSATQELIRNLQANPRSRGAVIGYFLRRPSAALKRRLRVVKALFHRSGLPPDRYVITSMYWNDEYSETESEPPYPRVFLLEEGEFIDGTSAP